MMDDAEIAAVVRVVTEEVANAVLEQVRGYIDDRVDWIMHEVQAQILDFEHRVGQSMDLMGQELAAMVVHNVQRLHGEKIIVESYQNWLMGEVVKMGVGVGDFAKILSAVKNAEKDEGDGANGAGSAD